MHGWLYLPTPSLPSTSLANKIALPLAAMSSWRQSAQKWDRSGKTAGFGVVHQQRSRLSHGAPSSSKILLLCLLWELRLSFSLLSSSPSITLMGRCGVAHILWRIPKWGRSPLRTLAHWLRLLDSSRKVLWHLALQRAILWTLLVQSLCRQRTRGTRWKGGTNISRWNKYFTWKIEIFVPGVRIFRGSKYYVTVQ